MGREWIGQVPGGCRVAHHVRVKRRVGRVRPGHGQALPLVLHPAVLEPNLRTEERREPSPAAARSAWPCSQGGAADVGLPESGDRRQLSLLRGVVITYIGIS